MATSRQITCSLLLQAEGLPAVSAAALVGNFSQESGINLPTAFRVANLDHGSNGLAQWRLDRLTKYEEYVKSLHPTASDAELWQLYGRMAYQVKFAVMELKSDYRPLYQELMLGGDITTLTEDVCWKYERPNVAESGIANRIAQAKAVYLAAPRTTSPSSAQAHIAAQASKAKAASKTGAGTAVIGIAAIGGTAFHGLHGWEWAALGGAALVVAVIIAAAIAAAKQSASASATLDHVAQASVAAKMAASPAAPAA